jgi:hypothetical protein
MPLGNAISVAFNPEAACWLCECALSKRPSRRTGTTTNWRSRVNAGCRLPQTCVMRDDGNVSVVRVDSGAMVVVGCQSAAVVADPLR